MAQKIGQVCGAIEPLFSMPTAGSLGESRNPIHNSHEFSFDIGLYCGKFVDGSGYEYGKEIVVG
jgi:hypothetical protein